MLLTIRWRANMGKSNNKLGSVFTNGIIASNPVLKLVLGTCPTLAVSVSAFGALGMGIAVTFVLVCSNIMISLLRNVIPDKVRIPAFILIIATFVTLLQMLLQKFVPALYDVLGIYLPLIVVNCIILARAEAFASQNPVVDSALDGFGMGLGYTLAVLIMAIIREFLGAGSFFAFDFMGFSYSGEIGNLPNYALNIFTLPAGGFLTFGILIAIVNQISMNNEEKKKNKAKTDAKKIEKAKKDLDKEEVAA